MTPHRTTHPAGRARWRIVVDVLAVTAFGCGVLATAHRHGFTPPTYVYFAAWVCALVSTAAERWVAPHRPAFRAGRLAAAQAAGVWAWIVASLALVPLLIIAIVIDRSY